MKLDVLTREQCELVRQWRNDCLETLRTPYPLTKEQQEAFYRDVVCNRNSPHRYWSICENGVSVGVHDDESFVGMGGLTNIQWENRIAEISLVIDPQLRGKGFGEKAVDLLLTEGFDRMGLKTVCGECYFSNQALGFWDRICARGNAYKAVLKNRKFWGGCFYDSLYFSIDRDE